jgi:AsmA-like C-terminal region
VKLIKKITKGTLKYFFIPLITLAFIAVLGAIALFYFFPKDKLLTMITTEGESFLKRKVVIRDISYNLRGVTLSDCSLLKSTDPADSALVSADSIALRISITELINNKIKIQSIVIKGLNLNLTHEKDKWNLEDPINEITESKSEKPDGKTKTEIDYIQLVNANISVKNPPEAIKPLAGDYEFNGTIRFPENALSINDFSLRLTESRGFIEGSELIVSPLDKNFIAKGTLKLTDVYLGWIYKWQNIDFLPYTHVAGTASNLMISSKEVAGHFNGSGFIKGRAPIKASGSFIAYPETVSVKLTDLSAQTGSSSAKLKFVNVPPKGDPSFSATSIEGNLEELTPLIPFAPGGISGKVSGSLSIEGKSITCDISLKNGRFGEKSEIIGIPSADLSMKGNILKIEDLPVLFYGQKAHVSIAAPESIFKEIIANIKCSELDLDKVFPATEQSDSAKSVKSATELPSSEIPLRLRGSIDIQKITYNGYTFSRLFAVYDAAKWSVQIPRFSSQFLDASITGSSSLDFSRKSPGCDFRFNINDLKVQRLAEIKKDLEKRIFGIGQARGSFRFNPFSDKPEETLQGRVEFQITNGKVANTGIQDELGVFLESLKYKLKDLEFNRINGTINLVGKSMQFNPLVFTSPDIRLMAEGNILQGDILDSRMTLEFNNTFIQDLPNPALLALNKYKKGRWFTVNFTAKGKISEGKYDVKEKD